MRNFHMTSTLPLQIKIALAAVAHLVLVRSCERFALFSPSSCPACCRLSCWWRIRFSARLAPAMATASVTISLFPFPSSAMKTDTDSTSKGPGGHFMDTLQRVEATDRSRMASFASSFRTVSRTAALEHFAGSVATISCTSISRMLLSQASCPHMATRHYTAIRPNQSLEPTAGRCEAQI